MASSIPKHGPDDNLALLQTVVLVGLMGAGKTSIGRKAASRLKVPFFDSDTEIEEAAAMSVSDIFATHGEATFRDAERKIIQRLLSETICIIATGGGAFVDERTRQTISASSAKSVWLRASVPSLLERISRPNRRPLLAGKDAATVLGNLSEQRKHFYETANIIIDSDGLSADRMTDTLIETLIETGLIGRNGPDKA